MIITIIILLLDLLVISLIAIKWYISTLSITYFCIDNFRKPTSQEITTYTSKAISNLFKREDD